MVNRTTNITGRVLRNLKNHGITTSQIQDEEVWDELSNGQDNIISEINTDKTITITLETGIDIYPLTTDAIIEDAVLRKNVGAVKAVKLPADWLPTSSDYGNVSSQSRRFDVVSNKEFIEFVNVNQTTTITHPVIGTVVGNQLKIFPAPSSSLNNVEMEFFVYLISSTQKITGVIEPELPNIWDKCLECFATAQFLNGNERQQWLSEYSAELRRLRPAQHRKHFNLQRPSVW
jgi:hypothetical protein